MRDGSVITAKGAPVRVAVLASGRGSNLEALIQAWRDGKLPVTFVGVGSDRSEAQALKRAQAAAIPVQDFAAYSDRQAQEAAITAWLEEIGTQVLVLAGYMRLLTASFIQRIGIPILNIHPSLLPSFPGLHPHRQALAYGVKISGCTVHYVDEGVDSGPIILQRAVPVLAGDSEESLAQRILTAEHELYPEALLLVCSSFISADETVHKDDIAHYESEDRI